MRNYHCGRLFTPRKYRNANEKAFRHILVPPAAGGRALRRVVLGSGSAQAETVLGVNPSQMEIAVGGQAALSVLVSDVVDLNAFDIELTYDPQVLTLSNWGFGSF